MDAPIHHSTFSSAALASPRGERAVAQLRESSPVRHPADSPRWWLAFAAYITVYAICSLAGIGQNTPTGYYFYSLAFVPVNLGAVYWLLRAAQRRADNDEKAGLRFVAAAYATTVIGSIFWTVQHLVDPAYGKDWHFDGIDLLGYTLGIIALTRFPVARSVSVERNRRLLDLACIVVAVGALIYTFIVSQLSWQSLTTREILIETMYPVFSIVTIALLCRLFMSRSATGGRRDLLMMAIAMFLQVALDLVLQVHETGATVYGPNLVWLPYGIAYVMIIYGAELSSRMKPDPAPRDQSGDGFTLQLLPTVAGVAVYGVLIWAAEHRRGAPLLVLVLAAILLNILFLVKQTMVSREHTALQAQRAEAESRARYEEFAREGQKLEAIGRLAGGVAHDFNNLLTTVLANSEYALSRMHREDVGYEAVSDIRSAAVRGADLIGQLLAFGRKSVIAPVKLQPALVLRDVERLLQRLAGERCGLLLELPAELGTVQMDRGQLEQALANLVANSRDAMPNGGAIVISGRNVVLDDSAAAALSLPAGDYVAIAVQDEGVGIPAEVRDLIFEPFFSTKERGKGTGLGLASTYGIIRQSNGGIDVQSTPGQGSCFTLYLPRLSAEPVERTPAVVSAPVAARDGQGETILLVEDEAAVRQVTRRILASEGYHVITAGDAVAARAMFEQHGDNIALMISDIMMPGETGTALAAHARRCWPGLDVIFISGYANNELPDANRVQDSDDFVQKPFTGAQLLARVNARLRMSSRPSPTAVRIR